MGWAPRLGVILWLQLSAFCVYGQAVIKGKVIDKITREPLALAFVTDTRTHKNTLTDPDGAFLIWHSDALNISEIQRSAHAVRDTETVSHSVHSSKTDAGGGHRAGFLLFGLAFAQSSARFSRSRHVH